MRIWQYQDSPLFEKTREFSQDTHTAYKVYPSYRLKQETVS